jgi:hypothetical protein
MRGSGRLLSHGSGFPRSMFIPSSWQGFSLMARMNAWLTSLATVVAVAGLQRPALLAERIKAPRLKAGFAEADITPKLGDKPVYMAGFDQNRKAKAVHDPLKARAIVLSAGGQKLAIVSIDVVGFFYADALRVRKRLPGFTHVVVTSTHNHEGPDTLGLWGKNPFSSGVDPAYMQQVEDQIVKAVEHADTSAVPVVARLGTARAPELLHDGREPYVKHDELVAIQFFDETGKTPGILVQWNCHPETLGGENTSISSDFVGPTVNWLQERFHCPVVYLTGTVGGLMTSLHVEIKDENGKVLPEGSMRKTERYGQLLGQVAERALSRAEAVVLGPIEIRTRKLFVPLDNKLYLMGRKIGVFKREGFWWEGDPYQATPTDQITLDKRSCLQTEIGWIRLGELEIALIPGEIYPELVLDKVQDPADPAADFPQAPIEPAIYKQMTRPYRMIIGLANDEVGYIIPKRQWDENPPFCYGRKKAQYGEMNSVGPEAAPILCKAFKELVEGKK